MLVAGVLLAFAITASTTSAAGEADQWVEKLKTDKPSEWRMAQAYLAHMGPAALAELEELADGASRRIRQRLREVVALMMAKSIQRAELEEYPRLTAICAKKFHRADKLGRRLSGLSYKAVTSERVVLTSFELAELGGLGVPAFVKLTEDDSPQSRFYGGTGLRVVDATSQLPILLRLTKDEGIVYQLHGDYESHLPIGQRILPTYEDMLAAKEDVVREGQGYLRQLWWYHEGTPQQVPRVDRKDGISTWDDFWREAKPLMEAAWDSETQEVKPEPPVSPPAAPKTPPGPTSSSGTPLSHCSTPTWRHT